MRRPQQMSWTVLVTLLLAVSLFVPVEASTPCLVVEQSGEGWVEPAEQVHASCDPGGIEIMAYGECDDVDCCGGNPEAPCKPAAV